MQPGKRSGARSTALPGNPSRWAMLSSLLMLSFSFAGCASLPQPMLVRAPIDPPPASLAAPCDEGPGVPAGDVRLADLIDVWQAREAAAAECRAKHAGLVKAWPQ
jgi:hypothetical protein